MHLSCNVPKQTNPTHLNNFQITFDLKPCKLIHDIVHQNKTQ